MRGERERERILTDFLADEISKLSIQCEEWRSTLDTVQEARAQDRMHSQQLLATKVHDYENHLNAYLMYKNRNEVRVLCVHVLV